MPWHVATLKECKKCRGGEREKKKNNKKEKIKG